jgi:hypothetical protein
MGLESTKKTDGIIQDQEGPAGLGKFSVIIIATSLFSYIREDLDERQDKTEQ